MNARDPRLTPARPDLAAEFLRGAVAAGRFAAGGARQVTAAATPLRRAPSPDAPQDSEALHGESVTVYDERDGYAWGQMQTDGYVGYLRAADLGVACERTHHVVVPRTFVYPGPSIKLPIAMALSLGARLRVSSTGNDFLMLENGGHVFAAHAAPLAQAAPDFVSVAETLLHVPYLWGGRSSLGLDCSGLVQLALAAAGIAAPRDSDQQEASLGAALPDGAELRRGDVVFWKGHVGILADAQTLLHASGHHMMVAREPLAQACARILAKSFGAVTGIRRLPDAFAI